MREKELKLTIGRSTSNDIVLADDSISRFHAEMNCSKNGKLLLVYLVASFEVKKISKLATR